MHRLPLPTGPRLLPCLRGDFLEAWAQRSRPPGRCRHLGVNLLLSLRENSNTAVVEMGKLGQEGRGLAQITSPGMFCALRVDLLGNTFYGTTASGHPPKVCRAWTAILTECQAGEVGPDTQEGDPSPSAGRVQI